MANIQGDFKKTHIGRLHTGLYKELEVTNLESSFLKQSIKQRQNNILQVYGKNLMDRDGSNKSMNMKAFENRDEIKGDVLFHRATRNFMLYGQMIGLNPVTGILEDDPSKLRFTFFSLKVLLSLLMFTLQSGAFIFYCRKMFQGSMNILTLSLLSFYGSTSLNTFAFVRVAMKWSSLVKAVAASKLEEYMDTRMKRRINITAVVVITLAIVEHSLAIISVFASITDCVSATSKDILEVYTQRSYPWLQELGIPYSKIVWALLQVFNTTTTLSWNYYDVYIICISFYLTSIFERINKKIASAKRTKTSLEFWRSIREDYTRATGLVRFFDDVISGVIFTSFVSNLFFICLQLFNILSYALSSKPRDNRDCPNFPSGPFNGYEISIYLYYSLLFILGRTLMVSSVTASVHSTSMMVAPALYELPSSLYCDEIQRFVDQVHNNKVAFSGLQFFYVTKEMILAVAGTIVTYELVLLQFSGDETIYSG